MRQTKTVWLLLVAGVLLWLVAILPAYYVVHPPLLEANLQALADVGSNLLVWLALLGVASALGSRLTRRLAYHSLLERLIFSAGLGLGLFSLATFALALAGLLYRWLLWGLLLASALLLWRELWSLLRDLRAVAWPRPSSPWSWFLTLFSLGILVLALTLALTPPIEWDALTYHLVGPERYLQAQRFTIDFDNYYLFFPSFTEMLFTLGMGLKSDIVAHLIHFGFLLLTLGAMGGFAARFWQRRTGLLAAALLLSIPSAVQIAAWAYVDLALTFYTFVALYALLIWLSQAGQRQTGWLVLAGLLAGVPPAIKYTGYVGPLLLGLVLAWELVRGRLPMRRFLRCALAVAGLVVVVAFPWYLKNLIVTGNPLYPLLWGGRGWNEIDTRWLTVLGEEKSVLDLLLLPWTLIVLGKQGTVAYDATYSPLFLVLLPMILLVRRRAAAAPGLALATAIGFAAWVANGAVSYGRFVLQGRMLLPVFAPLALLCARGYEELSRWDRPSLSLSRLLGLVVALVLTVHLVSHALFAIGLDPLPYLVGLQSREQYQAQYIAHNWRQAISQLNDTLTAADRVLFVWEPRSYGCQVSHQADVLFDNVSQRLAKHPTAEEMARGLRAEGFTHILANESIYPWIVADYPLTPEERTAWEAFKHQYLTDGAIAHGRPGELVLYRLPGMASPTSAHPATVQTSEAGVLSPRIDRPAGTWPPPGTRARISQPAEPAPFDCLQNTAWTKPNVGRYAPPLQEPPTKSGRRCCRRLPAGTRPSPVQGG